MTEIRARELRFVAGEAAALVHAVSGVQLSEADLADLMERTEGWPAGVYLAAEHLLGQEVEDEPVVTGELADEGVRG